MLSRTPHDVRAREMSRPLPHIDAVDFHRSVLPDLLLGKRGTMAAKAARGLGPLVLTVDDHRWTYALIDDVLEVHEGATDDPWLAISVDQGTWNAIAASLRTILPLCIAGAITIEVGTMDAASRWEVALRALYFGKPAYDPEGDRLILSDGSPLDLSRSFSLDDDPDEMAAYLRTAGFLHVRNVFDSEEIDTLLAEVATLAEHADPADPHTTWATSPDGVAALCRIAYAHHSSTPIRRLIGDPRMDRLAALVGVPVRHFPELMHGPTVILKPPGQLKGLANLPWHQDCWFGAHPLTCPSVALGIQLTSTSPEQSHIEYLAGSEGYSVRPGITPDEMSDWPVVRIAAEPGDVTVHLDETLHAAPAPTGRGERTTIYLRYFPPTLDEFLEPGEDIAIMLERTSADHRRRCYVQHASPQRHVD